MAEVDDVALDSERPNASSELRSQASESRPFAEEVESVDDRIDEPVGRRRVASSAT